MRNTLAANDVGYAIDKLDMRRDHLSASMIPHCDPITGRPGLMASFPAQTAPMQTNMPPNPWSEMMWNSLPYCNGLPETQPAAAFHSSGVVGERQLPISSPLTTQSAQPEPLAMRSISVKLAGFQPIRTACSTSADSQNATVRTPETDVTNNTDSEPLSPAIDPPAAAKPPLNCAPVASTSEKTDGSTKEGKRRTRCNKCDGCLRPNCGSCNNCLDKKEFGGLGVKKQACVSRKCLIMKNNDGVVTKKPRSNHSRAKSNSNMSNTLQGLGSVSNTMTGFGQESTLSDTNTELFLQDPMFDTNITVDENCKDLFDEILDPDEVDADENALDNDFNLAGEEEQQGEAAGFEHFIDSDILQWSM